MAAIAPHPDLYHHSKGRACGPVTHFWASRSDLGLTGPRLEAEGLETSRGLGVPD